ncbi:hypothetical protein [Acinetobacter modestus]|uniref:hypothetical protein n=1 Tax=Acinetobacter modestus TaxID=1776740 RepID=UPI003015DDBF
MKKLITGVLLVITCTYALAEEQSTYKILLNKNTKEIKILKRINHKEWCENALKKDKSAMEYIIERSKNRKETWVKATYSCRY